MRKCRERRIRERNVIQAGVRDVLGLGDGVGRTNYCDPVVFVIVCQEGQNVVFVHDVCVEQVAVELDHGLVVCRWSSEDDVGEYPWGLADNRPTGQSLPWCCDRAIVVSS